MASTRVIIINGDRVMPLDPDVFASDGFVRDARNLLQLERVTLDAITNAIDEELFLGGADLKDLIAEHVDDESVQRSVRNLLRNLAAMRRRRSDDPEAFESKLTEALREGLAETFDDTAELAELVDRIGAVAVRRPALERQHKVEKLVAATASRLRELNLISDLRPVFDDDREVVEGVVPITTLALSLDDEHGLPHTVTVRLSASELDDLCAKAQQAQKKVVELKKLMEEKQIPVPSV